jgi:hypothetical protein
MLEDRELYFIDFFSRAYLLLTIYFLDVSCKGVTHS